MAHQQFNTTTNNESMKRDRAVWKSVGVSNIGQLTKNAHHSSLGVTNGNEMFTSGGVLGTVDMMDR